MSPEQLIDALDCQRPQAVWEAMVEKLRQRAMSEEEVATSLERDVEDAKKQVDHHYAAAQEFYSMALALEGANVTFAAKGQAA